MWYIEEGTSSAPRAEIQPCSDITLAPSHVPQACDIVVDPRMGELARSCCSNTPPILRHPCLQGVWCSLPETSYLVYSKYFLSFSVANISLSLHVFLQEQKSLPCTPSMDVTLSVSRVFYQLVVFSRTCYLDGQMWACWQWLFSRQSDRTSFTRLLYKTQELQAGWWRTQL